MAIEGPAPDGKTMLTVVDAADLRCWLAVEHGRKRGVWLVRARPGSDHPALDYEDMIAELLCFGWVDATVRVLDERRSLLWISPRRKGSVWSGPNKVRVARLADAGRLSEAGIAAVERAKADGSWTVLDGPERLVVPPDLAAAFAAAPSAQAAFDALTPSARKQYLGWIAMAKTDATRARRVETTIERCADGLRP